MIEAVLSVNRCLVLDRDPDLGAGLASEDWAEVRRSCQGELVHVRRGRFDLAAAFGHGTDVVALVALEGMLCREIGLRDRSMLELLGPFDMLRLPSADGSSGLQPEITVTAVTETLVLVLGASFIHAAGRWPSLLTGVLDRLETQRERLAVQGLIAHFSRAEDRLLLMLWHLADRWGYRTPDGVVLALPLTHDFLGRLIGGRRPTMTVAANTLQADGIVTRLADGSWLLREAAEHRVQAISQAIGPPLRPLGDGFMLRNLCADTAADFRALRAEAVQLRAAKPAAGSQR